MYCDGSITIMWTFNVFINYFPVPCRRVKISLFKILDSDLLFVSSVFQLSSDVSCHPILQLIIWNLECSRHFFCIFNHCYFI